MKGHDAAAASTWARAVHAAQKTFELGLHPQGLPAELLCNRAYGHRFELDLYFADGSCFKHFRLVLQHAIKSRYACGAETQRSHFCQLCC